MAHEFESGFFVRVPAWHRLGVVVNDAPTTEEAIILAGLNWEVMKAPLYVSDYRPEMGSLPLLHEVESHQAIVRQSDKRILGVVGSNYRPLQNAEAFRFFDPILEGGHAKLEAAGSLRNGKRVWILARLLGADAEVVPGDQVSAYLLLSNAHDGTQAVRVQFTTIRVVCMNTLGAAERRGDTELEHCLKVRHVGNLEQGLEAVQKVLDFTNRTFRLSVEAYQALAQTKLPIDGLAKYVQEIFDMDSVADAYKSRVYDGISARYWTGPGGDLPGVIGSYWGAYNAVTDWLDHTRGKSEESRLHSSWFGEGRIIRERALQVALQAVN